MSNRHFTLKVTSDSSDYKWAGTISGPNLDRVISDYWNESIMSAPIMIKEALALSNSLLSVSDVICNKRSVAYVDNQAVVYAWENQYSKNYDLAAIMKDIFQIMMKNNCSLTLVYVPSSENQADLPSRILSKSDTTISKRVRFR